VRVVTTAPIADVGSRKTGDDATARDFVCAATIIHDVM
jgi:hypothetical protein